MIDPRGPRFAAWVTSGVLAVVLVSQSGWLLLAQALVFGLGAWRTTAAPYGRLYARAVRPRLAPPTELEDARPPQFAQAVGLVVAGAGAAALLSGATALGLVLTAAALSAAFLNAAFGLCLGCEAYLLYKRTTTRGATA